jgi:phage protein D
MTMLTPAYRLTFGSSTIDTTDEPRASTVVDLTVSLDLDAPADAATLVLGQVGTFRPAEGDEAVVGLGYAGEGESVETVLTGAVSRVEPGLVTNRVSITGAMGPLLTTFVDETFEERSAGAILRDLAERAGVQVAEAENGIDFPAYVIDGRRSAAHHARELASLSGLDLWADPEGRLVMKRWAGGRTVHVLEYGRDLLAVEAHRAPPRYGRAEAWGESPTGAEGSDAWGWLTPDFRSSRGTAGSGGSLLLLEHAALRTRDAARTAAEAALAESRRRAFHGRLRIVGRPGVRLGDAVRLSRMPDSSLDRSWQVRSVTHRITKAGGFTTEVAFRSDD